MSDTAPPSPNTSKPVLVMGANGFMGSHVTKQLLSAGRRVRVMVRKTSDTRALEGLNVETYYGDITDRSSVLDAMQGCTSVFYNVVDTRAWLVDPSPLYATNVEALQTVLSAAIDSELKRFIFTSSMVTLARYAGTPAIEASEFDWWHEAPHYVKSRVLAERAVLEAQVNHGLPAIVLCVANTYGPEDYGPTPHGNALWQATKHQTTALDCSLPTVDIRDAAHACLLAEQHGRVGERYAIVNELIHQRDFYAMAGSELGHPPPKILSMRKAYVFATLAEIINRIKGVKDAKFCRTSMFLSEAFGAMSHEKASKELGWTPRPLSDTVADAIRWYRTQNL